METINLFTRYKQEENQFTNGLISLLALSATDGPAFARAFLAGNAGVTSDAGVASCRVLEGIDGTADAELCGGGCRIQFECKISSGALRPEQVERHLVRLRRHPEEVKRLILLTPDDSRSRYVGQFVNIDSSVVRHLEW